MRGRPTLFDVYASTECNRTEYLFRTSAIYRTIIVRSEVPVRSSTYEVALHQYLPTLSKPAFVTELIFSLNFKMHAFQSTNEFDGVNSVITVSAEFYFKSFAACILSIWLIKASFIKTTIK